MQQLLPSKVLPSVPWQARHAGSDYGVSDEPDWRQVDWEAHLHRVEVGPDSLNYVDIGEGEGNPVVFVHGLGGQWQNFLENIPRVAQEHRVMALDLPGFGQSEMPAGGEISIQAYGRVVDGFCDALGLERVELVGNSMGGFIAAEVTIQNPDRVERLVLISAAGITSSNVFHAPARLLGRIAHAATAVTAARHRRMARRPVTRHLALALVARHPSKLRPDTAWEGLIKGADGPGLEGALMASVKYDYRDRLEEIGCPTLIIWGENDSVISVEDAHEYERRISDSRKTVMEDTGHVPMVERPRAVNDVLLEFLAEAGEAEEKEPADAVSERR
ncbi:MAG: alpha/beta fold hydrolase [Actinomycetota bacterium]|nr:alpha/beta fold hydrolase [Actinomycetota bacterium]